MLLITLPSIARGNGHCSGMFESVLGSILTSRMLGCGRWLPRIANREFIVLRSSVRSRFVAYAAIPSPVAPSATSASIISLRFRLLPNSRVLFISITPRGLAPIRPCPPSAAQAETRP